MSAFTAAKRGDLVVIESVQRDFIIGQPTQATTRFDVCEVASITRDGMVKAVRYLDHDDSPAVPIARLVGFQRALVIRAASIDKVAAVAAIRQHTWRPGDRLIKPWSDLAEIRALLAPFARVDVAA